jgi:large subunit ribosomal protein L24
MKIHKGDEIIVTIGKDKGKMGRVEKVFAKTNALVVPGVSEFKRHKKGRMQGQKSEIVTVVKPIIASKVSLMCPKCHKPTRVGYKIEKDKKVRVCRKCNAVI